MKNRRKRFWKLSQVWKKGRKEQ